MTSPLGPKILIVIHHRDDATTLRNAAIAAEAGVHGVALIQMEGRDWELDEPARAIRAAHPELFLVINRLSAEPAEAILADHKLGIDGSWIDNPGLSSAGPSLRAGGIDIALGPVREENPDFAFFGSVAFKTQAPDPDPGRAARLAVGRGWIATTSGPATGVAPDIAKLKTMRDAVGAGALAVASGVTPDNAHAIAPLVDWILVATGVTPNFYDLDLALTRRLVEVCAAAGVSVAAE